MIIGLNGRMQSGKDTVANILQAAYSNVERVAFADKLKDSAAAALQITRDQLEELKLHGTIQISSLFMDQPNVKMLLKEISGREYLQYYGTEAHREIFGDGFWVEQALDNQQVADGTILVVTDMRFPNEISAILDRGGIAVKIRREEADSKPILHASEQTLPDEQFDYFLDNNGTKQDLIWNVLQMVTWIEENRPQFRFDAQTETRFIRV